MSESPLDECLLQLVETAQRQPLGSRARRKALAQLINELQSSNQLSRPRRGQFQGFYEDIYREALQRLFTHICDRIHTYSPEKGRVLQWVNFLLNRRFFIEASRDMLPTLPKGIDARTVVRLSLDDLDATARTGGAHLPPSLSEDVKAYLQEDPNHIFQNTYIQGHPQATFQYIALKRLDNYSWKELSTELSLGISTLSSFYQRCIERFAPRFRQDLL